MTAPDPERRFTAIHHAHQPQVYAYAVSRPGRASRPFRRSPSTEKTGYRLYWSAEALILDLPVTSQARAGAYRMLAWHGGTLMHYTVIEEGRYTDAEPA